MARSLAVRGAPGHSVSMRWVCRGVVFSMLFPMAFALSTAAAAQEADPLGAAAARGDWARAETMARAAVAADRRSATGWTYLGLAEDHEGKKREALQAFAEAARLSPDATFAHNNYGASLEANGNPARAAEEYRLSLELDRNQPAALVNLARLRMATGTPAGREEAQALLRSAWQLAPDAEIARSLLSLAPCARAAMPFTAPPAELQPYGDLVASNATAVAREERPRMSRALLACGLIAEAQNFNAALLAADPRDADAVVGKAQAERAAGQPAAAGRTLETAVAGGMESPAVYAELAQVYQQTGHMDNAVTAMRRALALAPNDDSLQFRYGMLLLDTHAPKAAELRMRQAVERAPRSARLWFALGLAQFDQTRPADAQVSFDHAIALDATFAPALAYRGLVALDQQHYSEAEAWNRKATAADPSAADLHCLLAEALERQHPSDSSGIRAELARALALDPKFSAAYLTRGRLDLEEGRPKEASEALETALRLDPSQLQAHFYLARAYRQLHDTERAATESKLFSEQQATAEAADRTALQNAVRQLAHTSF